MFKNFHLASLMAQSSACCSPWQNPHNSKNELAGGTPTKGSNRWTPAPAATRAPTPTIAPVVAPLIASGSNNSSVVIYLEDDFQQIVRTILKAKTLLLLAPAPVPALVVAAAPHYKGPRKRPLKTRFPNIYWGKTHLECYNFFQQCEDHFATSNVTGSNRVLFAATFLKKLFWSVGSNTSIR